MIRSVLTPIELQNLKKLCLKLGIDPEYIDPELDYYENRRALYELAGKTPPELNSGLTEREDPYYYYDKTIFYDFIDIPIKNDYKKVLGEEKENKEEFDFDFILFFAFIMIFLIFILSFLYKYGNVLLMGI